jgi:hypothetical protein
MIMEFNRWKLVYYLYFVFLFFLLARSHSAEPVSFQNLSGCPAEVISPKFTYELSNSSPDHNSLLWGNKHLQYFQNSQYLTDFIKKHYSNSVEWSRPVVFAVIADEKYIHSIEIMLETFSSFHLTQNDVLVLSLSDASSETFSKKGIRSFRYDRFKECSEHDTRCVVSLTKFSSILDLLELSYSVFFLDLDVFLKKFPFPAQVDSSIDLYNQWDQPALEGSFNFGCFFLRSNSKTIQLVKHMKAEYLKNTEEWDQDIWNRFILASPIKYSHFSPKEYFTFEYLDTPEVPASDEDLQNVTLAHITCVEGSLNKFLFGRVFFQSFSTPSFYHPCHTIVTIEWKREYSHDQLVQLIKVAVKTAQILNRSRIRLIGWDYYSATARDSKVIKSLYDSDRLFKHWNITLLENRYWENVRSFHPDFNFKTHHLNISSHNLVEVHKYQGSPHEEANDIILTVDLPVEMSNDNHHYSNLLCGLYNSTRRNWCLETCSGKHF